MKRKKMVLSTIAVLFVVGLWFYQSAYGQPWDGNGTPNDPYQIWDANQMYALGYNPKYWDKNFVLMNDVDVGKFTGKSFNMVGNFYRAFALVVSSSEAKLYWTVEYGKIQRSNLDGTGIEDHISAGVINPRGIAIDDTNQKIYWTDVWTGKIKRANLDGTNVEDIIVINRGYPYGIALDISAGKVYWTDLNFGTIQKANIDGTNRETIIRKPNSSYPCSISVDTVVGKIYWTNPNAGRIQRSNLDGTNIEDLVTVGAFWIALDTGREKMYWSVSRKIQKANLDGTNIEDIILEDIGRPYWITLDINNEKVYWTNIQTDKVRRANFDGSEIENLISSKFTGIFDGNGHKIRNFTYEDSERDGVGLFERTGGTAEIRNVCLEDVNVTGDYCVGPLVGLSEGVVSNCSSSGVVWGCENVSGLVGMAEETSIIVDSNTDVVVNICDDYGFAAGGLVGHNFHGNISNCSASGSVKQGIDTYYSGGLIGFNEGSVTDCFATCNVSGYGMIGGLIGNNGGWGHIESCYATGNVLGNLGAGGLIGRNFAPVLNCYARGDVGADERAGGLIGWDYRGTMNNCYSTGAVEGVSKVGGLVGSHERSSYTKCFWDVNVNPDVNGIGSGSDPNVIGLPTAQMQDANTFTDAGWDFNTPIWKFCSVPNYPSLWWEECPVREPDELVAELLEEVAGFGLPSGIENSLMAKLQASMQALDDINENNDAAAINTLQAFINAVEAQRGNKISEADADALIASAQEIIDLLSME